MAKKWLDSIRKQRRRSNLKFLKKIAQISLPWQQLKIRFVALSWRTDGQEMARFHRETKKKNRFEGALQTYRQTESTTNKKAVLSQR